MGEEVERGGGDEAWMGFLLEKVLSQREIGGGGDLVCVWEGRLDILFSGAVVFSLREYSPKHWARGPWLEQVLRE